MGDPVFHLDRIRFNPTLVRLRRERNLRGMEPERGFQSHAGSIEASAHVQVFRISELPFQSHAGSIEALPNADVFYATDLCFNPTLVRLRPPSLQRLPKTYPPFQSHAGSIEARWPPGWTACVPVFQSHAGSIEARLDFPPWGQGLYGFNPTLVRLRPEDGRHPAQGWILRFNPTLVRLRPSMGRANRLAVFLFQSHAGSIEARAVAVTGPAPITGFNPTLVRLRPERQDADEERVPQVSIPRWFD